MFWCYASDSPLPCWNRWAATCCVEGPCFGLALCSSRFARNPMKQKHQERTPRPLDRLPGPRTCSIFSRRRCREPQQATEAGERVARSLLPLYVQRQCYREHFAMAILGFYLCSLHAASAHIHSSRYATVSTLKCYSPFYPHLRSAKAPSS